MKHTTERAFVKCVEELIRLKKVKNQSKLSELLGFKRQFMSDVMNGRAPLPLDKAKKFIQLFNVQETYLFEGFGEMFKKPVVYASANFEQLNEPSIAYGIDAKDKRIAELEYTIELQKEIIKKYKQSESKAKAG